MGITMVLISELCALLEEREILLSMTCIASIHVITCVNFWGEFVQTILCLLDREVLRGHRDYEQVVLDVKRSAKRFPPGYHALLTLGSCFCMCRVAPKSCTFFNTPYLLKCSRWSETDFTKMFLEFLCLQCFDAVGWAAGRASGLQKNWVVGCWHGYLSGARCRLAYGPADATATHCLLLHKNPDCCYLSGTG